MKPGLDLKKQLRKDLSKAKREYNKAVANKVRDVFSATCNDIIQDTPVVTGKLKNNWTASFTSPASGVNRNPEGGAEAGTKALFGSGGGGDSISSYQEVASKIDDKTITKRESIFFTNCLDYADEIEHARGSKKYQNPAGMLRKNVVSAPLKGK